MGLCLYIRSSTCLSLWSNFGGNLFNWFNRSFSNKLFCSGSWNRSWNWFDRFLPGFRFVVLWRDKYRFRSNCNFRSDGAGVSGWEKWILLRRDLCLARLTWFCKANKNNLLHEMNQLIYSPGDNVRTMAMPKNWCRCETSNLGKKCLSWILPKEVYVEPYFKVKYHLLWQLLRLWSTSKMTPCDTTQLRVFYLGLKWIRV